MSIELKGVEFCHPGVPQTPILKIPSWQVASGEQVFIHGPSGSGKSTLLNLLSGLLECAQGEISLAGERLDLMNRRQRDRFRANCIGYVFQRFNLIPYLSAIENIELARSFSASPRATQDAVEPLLEALNVEHAVWDRPTAKLSVGQQQRVAIARALVNRPQVLIADEPTSALDQHNRDNFLSVLMPLIAENNITLIFVSHDLSLAKHFTHIQALSDINEAA
ncbi:MAG: putative ABC transport system ATP-binding protein [Halieaceae bacterium]|jgi:putative ABC transport system ATP-binding protein